MLPLEPQECKVIRSMLPLKAPYIGRQDEIGALWGPCVVLTDLEHHCNCSQPEEWRRVVRMYAVKDLPVWLVVVQRRKGLSVALIEGDEERTRTNTHKLNSHLLPALSSLPLSPYSSPSHPPWLLNPPHHPHKHCLINLHPSIIPLPIQRRHLRPTPPIHLWSGIARLDARAVGIDSSEVLRCVWWGDDVNTEKGRP